jgi:hypothetical protein
MLNTDEFLPNLYMKIKSYFLKCSLLENFTSSFSNLGMSFDVTKKLDNCTIYPLPPSPTIPFLGYSPPLAPQKTAG